METATVKVSELSHQGFSLVFQQGVAFVVLSLAVILLALGLIYVFRLYNQVVEKFYLSSLEQTKVIAQFTEKLNDVIRRG